MQIENVRYGSVVQMNDKFWEVYDGKFKDGVVSLRPMIEVTRKDGSLCYMPKFHDKQNWCKGFKRVKFGTPVKIITQKRIDSFYA